MLIYSYINTSGNWKNEKLCGNTTPAGRSVFTQFRVFPIFTSVDITVYQYGKNVLYFCVDNYVTLIMLHALVTMIDIQGNILILRFLRWRRF